MSTLADILKDQIRETGPLSVYDFMDQALSHPEYGYYKRGNPFGKDGDFVTAPEISQMFGELIGLWCVDCWTKLGAPSHVHLVELGPGNGTLMKDALRSARLVPDFLQAATVHLVETSPALKKKQQSLLSEHGITWHETIPDFDNGPILLIANEFFDALPIRQYVLTEGALKERGITCKDGSFVFTLVEKAENGLPQDLILPEMQEGDVIETSPMAETLHHRIAKQLRSHGGAALYVDYGTAERAAGDSFQAVRNHQFTNPLDQPGQSDITAHVDFSTLVRIAEHEKCDVLPVTSQGRFLERLGIEARALALSRSADETQKEVIAADLKRLVSTSGMGTLFKALSFYHAMQAPPAGFAED